MKNIILLSGGMDSTTLLYKIRNETKDIVAVFYDYGQKCSMKEQITAYKICSRLGIPIATFKINDLFRYSSSGLLENKAGSYELEFRNGVLLASTISLAMQVYKGEDVNIYIGVEKIGLNYFDCSRTFIDKINEIAMLGSNGRIKIKAPFVDIGKDKVLEIAKELNVPLKETWSCYENLDKPCGKCDGCIDRKLLGVFYDTNN